MVNDSVTLVAAKGDMLVGGNDVSVEGIFGSGEFSFNLEKPVRIGSVMSITYWLKDVYNLEGAGVDVITIPAVAKTEADFLTIIRDAKGNTAKRDTLIAAIKKNLIDNGIPEPAQALMTSALLAEVSVDALKIDFRKEEKDDDAPAS
jgi:hypothetical protein